MVSGSLLRLAEFRICGVKNDGNNSRGFCSARLSRAIRNGSDAESLFFFLVVAAISVVLCVCDMFPELGSLWLGRIT